MIHSTCPPPQAYFKFLDALYGVLQGAKTTHPAAVFSPHLSKDQEEHQWSRLTSDVLSMARSVGKELKTSREEVGVVPSQTHMMSYSNFHTHINFVLGHIIKGKGEFIIFYNSYILHSKLIYREVQLHNCCH